MLGVAGKRTFPIRQKEGSWNWGEVFQQLNRMTDG
jgi:hypothetical protein